jgi:molybdopterin-containing oxidoreductase family membrane subunit
MDEAPDTRAGLRHIEGGGRGTAATMAILAALSACWLFCALRVMTEGHSLLGTSSYAVTWGILVANIIHIIGISHVGIAVSATVRVLGLQQYRSIARVAEIVTLAALVTAVLNIALDVGRPDRFITKTLLYGRWHAPMVWSMTVIVLYFLASAAYLYLSMRRDIWVLSEAGIRPAALYRMLALGYRDTAAQRHRHDRALYWLAICLVPIMVSVHSVYGFIFGLLPGRPGWHNPLQAPYFVLAAIVSGFSALIVIAALLRWAYSWSDLFPDRMFKVFGSFLAFTVFLYLYFLFSEHLTAQYTNLSGERAVSSALLTGRFSTLFWATLVAGLLLPFLYLFAQGVGGLSASFRLTALAAFLINVALWIKRMLLVVPAQLEHELPLPVPAASYTPTLLEWALTLGTYAVGGLLFLGVLRLSPVIDLPADHEPLDSPGLGDPGRGRGLLILTFGVGLFLIVWGMATRDLPFAPVKWLLGLALLVALPLEWCLIRGGAAAGPESGNSPVNTAGGDLERVEG